MKFRFQKREMEKRKNPSGRGVVAKTVRRQRTRRLIIPLLAEVVAPPRMERVTLALIVLMMMMMMKMIA